MPAKSHYLDNAILNHVLNATALPSPASVYIGLFTVAPTPSTSGTECSGLNYARVQVTAGFAAPVNGATQNSGAITFPAAGAGGWGIVSAAGVFDSLAGGNLLYYGTLSTPKAIDEADTASFGIGTLAIVEQ